MTFYSPGYAVSSGNFLSQSSLGMFSSATAVWITVSQLIIFWTFFNRFPLEFVGGAPRGNSIQGKVSISCKKLRYFITSMTLTSYPQQSAKLTGSYNDNQRVPPDTITISCRPVTDTTEDCRQLTLLIPYGRDNLIGVCRVSRVNCRGSELRVWTSLVRCLSSWRMCLNFESLLSVLKFITVIVISEN